ncbi:hypothetical protein BDN70DRAFT_879804 [Pholiota conissans]|uniref:Uncharacterized protein n=1 Tax=Pholiota conissans TaxID=109636 RepID=A0A9P6CZR7_9AGAR|nr:hypothetical protein BDN70DRAFT_879804 [Pholiota conissans]
MCKHQVIGDFYRGCGHFHGRYYTGEITDCGSATCKTSVAHRHRTANNCGCPQVVDEDRKIQNMFQHPNPECQRAAKTTGVAANNTAR